MIFGAAAALMASPAMAAMPQLPPCKTGGGPVTLMIRTDTTSGWTVNGAPAAAVAHSGWANPSPATWIGPASGNGPQTLTYRIVFSAPTMHGPMAVSARWTADNCGMTLQAGTGPTQSAGACGGMAPNGTDFTSFGHTTNAMFSPADENNPNPSITFVVSNQPGSPTGMAGIFTVTARCVCPH